MISPDWNRYGVRLVSERYRVKHGFTTLNGSWEPEGRLWSIPAWARNMYLRSPSSPDYFDDAGGDHHFFIRVENSDGQVIMPSLGFGLGDNVQRFLPKERSGWGNQPVWNSTRGDGSPSSLSWYVEDERVLVGGGMPLNHHVSCFTVLEPKDVIDPELPDGPDEPESELEVSVKDGVVIIKSGGEKFRIEVI